jgi:hypothetical protein
MSIVLDVAIGISFLYLLLALIVTTVQELLATWLKLRAKNLYQSIADMLANRTSDGAIANDELLKSFWAHPLIKNLRQRKPGSNELNFPSYIPSKTFALALLDILLRTETVSAATGLRPLLTGARDTIGRLENHPDLKQALLLIMDDAGLVADKVDQEGNLIATGIENWFNDHMSRASGWYKRRAQTIALALAGVLAVGANANSIHVVTTLWKNGALRDSIVAQAQTFAAAQTPPAPSPSVSVSASASASPPLAASGTPPLDSKKLATNLSNDVTTLRGADFPIGWVGPQNWPDWSSPFGWLITALAVSLGAGFWFDVLSKALQLRGTGPKISAATGRTSDDDS